MISADKRSRWGTEVAVVPGRPGNAEGGHAESHSRGTVLLRWLTYSAAFSSSWTGATFGGFNVVDYALSATLVVFIAVAFFQRRHIHVRAWMVFPLAVAALVSAWNTIVGGADFDFVMMLRIFLTMVSVAVIVFSLSSWVGSGYLRRLLKAWVAGVALNALAAIAVSYGALSLAGILTQATGERLSGLASHPNSLAFSVCLALAPCLFLLSTESVRIVWAACLVLILWGGLLSESRAALLVGLPALALAVVVALARSQLRSFAWPVLVLGAVAAWFVVPLILADSRLAGGAGALSDAGRSTLNDSALRVFLQSPLTGAGFANQGGVAVPLTVLTAGGILFALGYYAFVLWPVPTLWAHRHSAVAPYGLITVAALIGFGVFNPVFMERATYWPILIALALCAEQRTNIGPMGPTASDQ